MGASRNNIICYSLEQKKFALNYKIIFLPNNLYILKENNHHLIVDYPQLMAMVSSYKTHKWVGCNSEMNFSKGY